MYLWLGATCSSDEGGRWAEWMESCSKWERVERGTILMGGKDVLLEITDKRKLPTSAYGLANSAVVAQSSAWRSEQQ